MSEMNDARYQKYAASAVYSIGDSYFAASKNKPKHYVGTEWKIHEDQFWASQYNTIVWVCNIQSF